MVAQESGKEVKIADKSKTEVRVFKGEQGWGYDIYVQGKKYIHQTTIPSIPGGSGFASKKDAKKVGELVVAKIAQNEMPPSVTPNELNDLKIKLTTNNR